MPAGGHAQHLTKAERLWYHDADGEEELVDDARGAAQARRADLAQVGRYKALVNKKN